MDIIFDEHCQRVPVWSWCRDVEPGARQQALDVSAHPAAHHHVALMPDAHQGFGMPIGGVAALAEAVSPNMVGVDIACGMLATRLEMPADQLDANKLEQAMAGIRTLIPMGFKHRRDRQFQGDAQALLREHADLSEVVAGGDIVTVDAVTEQLGTLGGGNHFLEFQADEQDDLWLMLHSGSRNLGKCVCETYHRLAKTFCVRHGLAMPNSQLAWFPDDSREGQSYLALMHFCLDFSRRNREVMLDLMLQAVGRVIGREPHPAATINIHHNYAARETHYGREVWVHRKGATAARAGELGIIPGSMGTRSYVVRGKGSPASFASCSHGAGRTMSRENAKRSLSLDDFRSAMQGVVCQCRRDLLDESPMAYKDIAAVMDAQKDLVEIVHELRPLAVEKG